MTMIMPVIIAEINQIKTFSGALTKRTNGTISKGCCFFLNLANFKGRIPFGLTQICLFLVSSEGYPLACYTYA